MANPPGRRVSENTAFGFYYALYYAILFFTTLFTTLREAPANDLYVFWHVPKRQYDDIVKRMLYSWEPIVPYPVWSVNLSSWGKKFSKKKHVL